MTTYRWGDVVLIDFPQSGTAQRKKRPALVVLDVGDADVVVVPITTRQRTGTGDQRLRDSSAAGLLKESWVRLAKVACLGKSDVIRRLGHLTDYDKATLAQLWRTVYTF